jgi:glyoxylase I family protein
MALKTRPIKTPIDGIAPLIQVFDMPTSIRFYRDVLGFAIAGSSGPGDDVDWVMLNRPDDIVLMLNTAYEAHERPASPDPKRVAAHEDTTFYFGCPDVDAFYTELRDRGVELSAPVVTKYNWKAISVHDPDGYLLCFHRPVD